ncbi:alpha-amylase family protein [Aestuariibacter halophilus]|uniref:Alpha-amylase family protein n=1 Tax=Fluctibacter halophilus TaxID=226011 RepID=A0ABS8G4H4_9ALTE|nr:alpha-amylase family protein [Aestuariibacter halophilus]MCC2615494.1 alpha-amylase family protein [Aestuariibacter halophilus]
MKNRLTCTLLAGAIVIAGCDTVTPQQPSASQAPAVAAQEQHKPVIYQVFTRLFGNKNSTNKPWGTISENGVGKFNDFTDTALAEIRDMGTSHIWYTGVPHHAVINDYRALGISLDDPDVVKGRAGSPYAVKDYYNVNPDLAEDPSRRLEEFEALIERTHKHGMKVIIDIVPNHVARNYQSVSAPAGVEDFGANDDTSVTYARHNNFYYVVGEAFQVPDFKDGPLPLGGESHPLADGQYPENPARWTGNGARKAQPDANDWYETIKVNYGVRPDGSHDFPALPAHLEEADTASHYVFWQDKDVPDSWLKFRDIVLYWLEKGVDGFRYDMAEMVPVAFWSYLNSTIKHHNPDALLLAEVYNPSLYRDYIKFGRMDYLYDKVGFYDTLKGIMQGKQDAMALHREHRAVADIEQHMLHFLENHDEQRIASDDFAGNAQQGIPAMAVSALISRAPTLWYFGQEVGEDGSEDAGFGQPTRTSIFDYVGVPAHQRWMNNGAFDGGQLSEAEKQLRADYRRILRLSAFHPSMQGRYVPLQVAPTEGDASAVLGFVRYHQGRALWVIANFAATPFTGKVSVPLDVIGNPQSALTVQGQLKGQDAVLQPEGDMGVLPVMVDANDVRVFSL